jgi:hypothetical protein
MTLTARKALGRLVVHDLPGAPDEPVEVDDLDTLLSLAEWSRVVAPLAGAVRADLVVNATDEWCHRIDEHARAAAASTMATHAALALLVTRLADAGVTDVRALKGCATGHLDYVRPTDRFSSDVDLLIRAEDHSAVMATFPADSLPPFRGRRWEQRGYAKATTVPGPSGVDYDLHVTLTRSYFGLRIPADELCATSDSFNVGGVDVRALDGPSRLIHAALHCGSSPHHNLPSALDIPRLVLRSGVDWRETVERVERWQIGALFAIGICRAWDLTPLDPHPLLNWARRTRHSRRQRVALGLMQSRYHGDLLTPLLCLPVRRWPAYLGPVLIPSRAYRDRDGRGWIRRGRDLTAEMIGRS